MLRERIAIKAYIYMGLGFVGAKGSNIKNKAQQPKTSKYDPAA